jgi:hypothetical protein
MIAVDPPAPVVSAPPLAYGGHYFEHVGTMGEPPTNWRKPERPFGSWWRCVHCYAVVPSWVLKEGWWMAMAGPWCQGRLRALRR